MRIGIFSDSHDDIPRLTAALEAAVAAGAEALLHCGDVVAAVTLARLPRVPVPMHVIHGNNTGDIYALSRLAGRSNGRLVYHGMEAALDLGGRRVFMVHYPRYARALATTGDWDVVCCGHNHKVAVEPTRTVTGTTAYYVNAGTTAGIDAPPTWVLGDLASLHFEVHDVPHPDGRGVPGP
ncbi:MAG: metallophosphoesterase family protein [Gammaproteobacteria bacterium]|nr:metallophosphoesterase family protein [Gammaproteobacteria bacterium]